MKPTPPASPKKVIFIGRFQPFHKGHEAVIRDIVGQLEKTGGKLTVGIGSANESRNERNPFTLAERKVMLELALSDILHKIDIIAINDKYDDAKWTAQVKSLGDFDAFVSTNKNVKRCLGKIGGLAKLEHPALLNRAEVQAKHVRQKKAQGEDITDFVHPKVAAYLDEINAERIIRESGASG
jgi:nicotinamide-nucleotide adenylyltransferase